MIKVDGQMYFSVEEMAKAAGFKSLLETYWYFKKHPEEIKKYTSILEAQYEQSNVTTIRYNEVHRYLG